MQAELGERALLDRQANQIEHVLAGMEMPVRVEGGRVSREAVRYHVTPMAGTDERGVASAAGRIAQAIGVREVRVSALPGGISVEVPVQAERELRLLPLLHAFGRLDPLSALVGMGSRGRPLLINLSKADTRHLLIEGIEGSGKSELLRTILLSLALTSRRSQMQVLGVDIGGQQLAVLEALPHALTDLAIDVQFARQLVIWLEEESARRVENGICKPDLVLIMDDMAWLETRSGSRALSALGKIAADGDRSCVHLLAAARSEVLTGLRSLTRAPGVVRAVSRTRGKAGMPRPGLFEFNSLRGRTTATTAWLSAKDLQIAADLASSGWRTRGRSLVGIGQGTK
ncbi:MAG: FtsK/SpoIIIE domain-containing protein [Anaerolineales bacterium]|jgi:S-DNA-T family DNA segregation ATPase FtsK/SpoIIIE